MDVTISIPDDMAHHLQKKWGDDLARRALESLALEAYRERLIGESRLQRWLGLPTRMEAHRFLKEHGVPLHYTLEDLEHDRQTHRRLGL
jgi:predicted HTH domain antitoxin